MREIEENMKSALLAREQAAALRRLPDSNAGIDFCSNDYLGLARDQELYDRWLQSCASSTARLGATGSRLISGNDQEQERVEQRVARYHGAEAGLFFSSGYAANLGLLTALCKRNDTVLYDELVHASLRDGLRMCLARTYSFSHNDLQALRQKVQRASGNTFIVVESVYSMDGDGPDLSALVDLAATSGAALIVDEAHATGVVGPCGEGGVAFAGLGHHVFARIHTFGKAVGSHGAVIVGSAVLREYLVNFARPFIYSTGLPPHLVKAVDLAYAKMEDGTLTQQLQERISQFRQCCQRLGLTGHFLPSTGPIQSLLLPGNERAKALSQQVQRSGFRVQAILHPTVPAGKERLRICLHSFNTEEEITQLLETIKAGLHD